MQPPSTAPGQSADRTHPAPCATRETEAQHPPGLKTGPDSSLALKSQVRNSGGGLTVRIGDPSAHPWVHNTSERGTAVPSGHRGWGWWQPRLSLSSAGCPQAGVGGRDPAGGGDSGLSEPESQQPPLPPSPFTKTPPRLPERDIVSRHGPAGTGHDPPTPPRTGCPPRGPQTAPGTVTPAQESPGWSQPLGTARDFSGKRSRIWDSQGGEIKLSGYPAARAANRGRKEKKGNGGGKAQGRKGVAAPTGCRNAVQGPGQACASTSPGQDQPPNAALGPMGRWGGPGFLKPPALGGLEPTQCCVQLL